VGRFTARRTAVGGDGAETFSSGRDCPMIGLSHAVSGSDWSPMGVVANPYVKKIRASELIAEWRRQGLSEDAIIERARQDDLLGSTLAPVDVPGIISLVDKGASRDDVVKLAAVVILSKATSGVKGTANLPAATPKGSGPAPGVLGLEPGSLSSKAIQNYYASTKTGSIEFVFDTKTQTFFFGKPTDFRPGLSPHQQLVDSIKASDSTVVGGMFRRGKNGKFMTNEFSGHYWKNWTPEVLSLFE